MRLFDISLNDIDLKDDRYRISYFFNPEKLLLSIKKIGLVSPLIVVKREDSRYVLVSGWKRIFTCLDLSLPRVPVFLLEEKDDCRVFLLSLYENLATRNFNILEKAEILHKLNAFIDDEKKIVRQFFPLLDIPATLAYLDIYLKIARLDSTWKKVIFEKKISLLPVQLLTEFTPEDREPLLPLILPMSLNKMKQFLEDLFELSKKTGTSPKAILSTPEIQSVSQADNLSSFKKAEKVRSLLRSKRYPSLSSWKQSFATSLKKARLSKEVAFDAPSFFEDGEFAVTFSLKNKEVFQKRLAKLQDLISDEDLFSMFNMDYS